MECFMSSYADAVQTLPSELQTHITSYLQSDLQHQNLLSLCKQYVAKAKQTGNKDNQKRLMRQLIMSLLAIQDICNRRIVTVTEMDHLVEGHMQKLVTARANLTTEPSQSCASGTENAVESEIDADDQAESDSRNGAVQSLHSRSATHGEDVLTKRPGLCEQEPEVRSGNQSSFKRKIRLPLRSAQQLTRSVGPRRALSRWDSGASRRRGGPSTLVGSKKTVIQALHQRCINEQRSRDRAATEQRQKAGGTYSRYANVQQPSHSQQQQQSSQQQQTPQQRQHQRIKHPRVLQRSLHTSRNRSVHLFDSARRRSSSASKKNKVRPTYMTSGRRLGAKLNRTPGIRLAGHTDWSNSDQYYFNDEGAEANTRSASHVSSEDEKEENTEASMMSPHPSSRSVDLGSWCKENGEGANVSEELDDSDYVDDDDTIDGASLSLREIKPYCGKDPKSRISSSPITTTGASSSSAGRSSRTNINRRRISRTQKLTDPETAFGNASSERSLVRQTQASPNSSLDMSSVQPRGNMSTTVYPLNSPMAKRREKTYGSATRHHRVESKQTVRPISEETTKLLSDNLQKPRQVGSSADQSSDGSISPDERLYCLCRRTSFGDMIACDNKLCEVEWFHFACVDIRIQPKGKWYCPVCRGDSFKVKRPDL
ncbi:Inhibitor of growth protein [Fasciola gigantica]|uniref:Inhibitor of growth protein n=1 Tax=Fasciola gigantica TaxID=46835 RepID=A0A504YA34_FASGI|nr:Inhibitor of growth protein [Fasciola gigantica]